MMCGIDAPQSVMKRGFKSLAACTTSEISTLSSPMTAVTSSRPDTYIRLSVSNQRGSSCVE